MAKQAKKIQTDYTTAGHDISQTASPLYQENLTRMNTYLNDPMARQDEYLNKYFSNTAEQSDFLRNYNRAMSGRTGANYAATGGGYSSANQQGYNDLQRYQNDLASRLQSQGVLNAYNMATQDYQNMLGANNAYNAAYQLGKEYSDIEQWNNMARQQNRFGNQLLGSLGTIGTGIGAAVGGVPGALIGNAIGSGLANPMTTDTSAFFGTSGAAPSTNQALGFLGAYAGGSTVNDALSSLFNRGEVQNQSTQNMWASLLDKLTKGKSTISNWNAGNMAGGQQARPTVGDFDLGLG